MLKNPPVEIKYLLSWKLIELGLQLLNKREAENLCP